MTNSAGQENLSQKSQLILETEIPVMKLFKTIIERQKQEMEEYQDACKGWYKRYKELGGVL